MALDVCVAETGAVHSAPLKAVHYNVVYCNAIAVMLPCGDGTVTSFFLPIKITETIKQDHAKCISLSPVIFSINASRGPKSISVFLPLTGLC